MQWTAVANSGNTPQLDIASFERPAWGAERTRLQVAMALRPIPAGGIPLLPERGHQAAQIGTALDAGAAMAAARSARIESAMDPVRRRAMLDRLATLRREEASRRADALTPAEMRSLAIEAWTNHAVEADFRRYYATQTPTRGDFEHAHEDGRRIVAALASGLPTYLLTGDIRRRSTVGIRVLGDASTDFRPDWPTLWVGMGPPPDWLTGAQPDGRQVELARRYWEIAAFRRAANRSFYEAPSLNHVAYALRAMARLGATRAFVKACAFKRGAWTVDLPLKARPTSLQGAWDCLLSAVGASVLRLPDTGRESGFLVQDWHPMVDETRCFVVDHRLVAAVPVRRLDTVYDGIRRPGARIEPRSCLHPSGAPSRPDRDGPAQRVRFARRAIAAIRREQPELRDYVLDVARDEVTGESMAIELNPLANAGLYACDPAILLLAGRAALARRHPDGG